MTSSWFKMEFSSSRTAPYPRELPSVLNNRLSIKNVLRISPYIMNVPWYYELRSVSIISCYAASKQIRHRGPRMVRHSDKQMWLLTLTSTTGPWFNITISSYQYRTSYYGDKTILRPSYLHNGISYTGKISLYWIRTLVSKAIQTKQQWCTVLTLVVVQLACHGVTILNMADLLVYELCDSTVFIQTEITPIW